MISTTTGQPDPCPMCGSADVRWRMRGWFDVVRNGLRYSVEVVLRTFLGWRRPQAPPSPWRPSWGTTDPGTAHEHLYAYERGRYEEKVSAATPRWFWRCNACRRKGHVFDDTFDDDRRRLARLEDRLARDGIGTHDPIDRDGLR